MLRWYLIYTRPFAELIAQSNLERQQFEVYFPRVVERVRLRKHWCERIVALFPRYLFLRLNEGHQSLSPVRSSFGVANVVRFGANYAVVPDRVIDDLRARADPLSGLHRLSSGPLFARGSVVKIAMHPFDGLEGVFEREDGAERSVVLLRLLGQEAPVRVPTGFLVPGHAT